MTEAYSVPPAPLPDQYDNQPPLTPLQRVTNTFTAPTRTFADLRRNTAWWLPFVLVVVFSYLFSAAAVTRIGIDGLSESAIRTNPTQNQRYQDASPEQRARIMTGTRVVMTGVLWSFILTIPLYYAISALLLWVGFNFILGGSGTYQGMFSVAAYAALPGIFRSVLIVVLMFAGDPENFNINNPVGSNPGFFLGPDASAFLKTLLTGFDLFSLWTLLLMAIGGAIVARVKVSSGIVMAFLTWLIVLLARSGIAAAMS